MHGFQYLLYAGDMPGADIYQDFSGKATGIFRPQYFFFAAYFDATICATKNTSR
jgi:hypothetical protein